MESSRSWPHISVESEVALGSVLPCDDTVPAVHPGDHHPLELLGCHDLHRHDRLQDGAVGLLHRWGGVGGDNGTSVNMTLFEQPWTEDARSEAHLVWERPLLLGWRRFHWNRPCGWRRPPGRIAPPRSCDRSGVPSRRRPWSPAAGQKEKDARWWTQDSSFHVVALTGAGEANLFNGRYKLLGDVGSNGLVFKLQLGVMLRLKRLKDTRDFTVLARSSRLLLVSEVKPAGRRFFFSLINND